MAKEEETPTEDATNPNTCPVQEKSIKKLWIALGIILSIVFLLAILMIGLGAGIRFHLENVDGTIVSPFPEIVEEYSPASSGTCFYPTIKDKLDDTYQCNFTNTNSKHFCPIDFACITIDSSAATPFGCQSEIMSCGSLNSCASSLMSLELLDGNESARVLSAYAATHILYFQTITVLLVVTIVVTSRVLSQKAKFQNYGHLFIAFAGVCLAVFIVFMIVTNSIFLGSTSEPFNDSGLAGSCYNKEVNSNINTAKGIGIAYFELVILGGMFQLVPLCFALGIAVSMIANHFKNETPDIAL